MKTLSVPQVAVIFYRLWNDIVVTMFTDFLSA